MEKKKFTVRVKEKWYTKVEPLFHQLNELLASFKLKFRINVVLVTGVVVFIGVGILFLTSKLYMPDNDELLFTQLGKSVELSQYTELQLKRWDYSESQNLMEIELKVNSKSVNTIYFPHVKNRVSGKLFPTEIVYNQDGIMIIHAQVKNPKQVTLIVATKENENQEKATGEVHFLSDYRVMNAVKDIQVRDKTTYFRMSIEADIVILKNQIQEKQATIEGYNKNISDCKTLISERKKLMEKQTTSEKKDSESYIKKEEENIQNYNELIAELQAQVHKLETEITEKQKITGQN